MTQSNRTRPATDSPEWLLDGREVRVSNLDKLFWPSLGLTKRELLAYYLDLSPEVLPYLHGRPLVLKAYPDGADGPYYFRQDLPQYAPAWLRRYETQPVSRRRTKRMPIVEDRASLVWLANQGAIELHPWLSTVAAPERPDYVMFDLDVESVEYFSLALEAASLLRAMLGRLDVQAFPKTSGGNGLHVLIPIATLYSFDETRAWVRAVAERLQQRHPQLVTTSSARQGREKKVLVDYAQNGFGKTTVAPYSVRPRPEATVSAPLSWAEVEAGRVRPADFWIGSLRRRVEEHGDLFTPSRGLAQRLTPLRDP